MAVPRALRNEVVELLHAGHTGIEKTKMIVHSNVRWTGTDGDITNLVSGC